MPSTYSPNLRIELIANGEQSGTWGSTTNSNLGTLIEDAISGYVSVSITSANQALTALNGAADQSRNMVINLTTITAAPFNVYIPPAEKVYIIRNASAYDATIYCSTVIGNTTAAGTGVTVPAGRETLIFSDATNVALGIDYVSSLNLASPLPVASGGTGLSSFTSGGAVYATSTTALTTGTLPIASGGTGATTAQAARNNLLPTQTGNANRYLQTDGTNASWDAINISTADVTGTLAIANGGTGASDAGTARTNLGLGSMATQAASSVAITGGSVNSVSMSGVSITSGSITGITDLAVADGGTGASDAATARSNLGLSSMATQASNNVSITGGSITGITDLAVADGGTGASSFTANNVLLGNGSSSFQTVAPSTSGNVLTSNGTTWTSSALPTAFVTGMIMLWSGSIATIPSGWALCDGTSGTPDLRNRFIVGAGNTYNPGNTGGSANATLVSHTHTATTTATDSGHSHTTALYYRPHSASGAAQQYAQNTTGFGGQISTNSGTANITASTSISTEGSSATNANLPPYYALAYIMKL